MVEYKCIEVTGENGNMVIHKRRAPNDKPYKCIEHINDSAELSYWGAMGWKVVGFTDTYYLLEREITVEPGESIDTVSGDDLLSLKRK